MYNDAFLTCLALNSITTGSAIAGIYSFNSGDQNLIFNQLYPTGSSYISGNINTVITPLINVGAIISNSTFSGQNIFRLGYKNSNDFALLLDTQYNACNKINGIDYCLLSSYTLDNSEKNLVVGINDANRIFLKTSGGYFYTLPKELTSRDLVYFSINQHQYINLGVFNVADNVFYSQKIDLGNNLLNTDDVYIGGEFNHSEGTGFYGIINSMVLFNRSISDINNCANCFFTTGYSVSSNISTIQIPQITGFVYSGLSATITSTSLVSGIINKVDGTPVNVEYINSSITGITSGLIALPLYGTTGVDISQPYTTFYKDTGILNYYNSSTIDFTLSLESGDVLEAYSYYFPVPNIGIQLIGYDVSNVNGIMQIVSNGLDETLNVDYQIVRNQVSGFYPGDILNYDLLNSQSVTVYFSGAFDNVFTGSMANTILNITGVSGICYGNVNYPDFGYDVFLNGQKLISGYEYKVLNTGTSGFYVSVSGFELWTPNGTGIDYSEIGFIPQFDNFIYLLSGVTNTENSLNSIIGFSPQIWINGIRQAEGVDYTMSTPCSTQSGTTPITNLSFNFYNNDPIFNFQYPPKPIGATGATFTPNGTTAGYLDTRIYWPVLNTDNYASGNFLNVLNSVNNGLSGLLYYDTSSTGLFMSTSGTGHGQNFCVQLTYRNGNIVSDSSPINCFNY